MVKSEDTWLLGSSVGSGVESCLPTQLGTGKDETKMEEDETLQTEKNMIPDDCC